MVTPQRGFQGQHGSQVIAAERGVDRVGEPPGGGVRIDIAVLEAPAQRLRARLRIEAAFGRLQRVRVLGVGGAEERGAARPQSAADRLRESGVGVPRPTLRSWLRGCGVDAPAPARPLGGTARERARRETLGRDREGLASCQSRPSRCQADAGLCAHGALACARNSRHARRCHGSA